MSHDRIERRHDIAIVGRLRTTTGARDVTILDISERGCRIRDRMGRLPENTSVTIKIGPIGPVDSVARWREGELVGLRFDRPLYPAVMEHIRQHFDLRILGKGDIDRSP
ncbi:PilZ domain-containing protein [Aurantiacibacter spongiae]|uniref:PilZ domain-containing protein n=1 Tax=Aurantiacibacter spongiae TaxID=2488860 RepID=UPI00131528B1|nr:PilZ domain-containing protein [Aurantiacibacter spongiae]